MKAQNVTVSGAEMVGMTGWQRSLRGLVQQPIAMTALVYLVLLAVVALLAPLLSPYSPIETIAADRLQGPSGEHWLGTDELGRDVLTRILFGARIALLSSFSAVAVAFVIGVLVGISAGYFGGWWDNIAMRACDILQAVPMLLMAFAIIGILGPSLTNAMIAVSILFAGSYARLSRAMTLSVRERVYVDAARVLGLTNARILGRHILPNVISPLIIHTSLTLGSVLLIEASLSFLGLGVELGTPSWGGMLNTARRYQGDQMLLSLAPGLAITLTVLAFNLLGDGLRDALANKPGRRRLGGGVLGGWRLRGEATARSLAELGMPVVPPLEAETFDPAELDSEEPPGDAVDALTITDRTAPVVAPPSSFLEVRNLTVELPQPDGRMTRILSDVSFSLEKGATLGLVGESGSGKSMTASAIMGMLPPAGRVTSGQVFFEGVDLTRLPERGMAKLRGSEIALVMQDPMAALSPVHTIGKQLAESLHAHEKLSKAEARDRSIELLDLVGVTDPGGRLRDYPHQFSGGMAQRVVIAAALASKPKLLIADEPSTALDVRIQKQVLELLAELRERLGMGLLLISHDLGVIAETCERVGVMYAGEIVELGEVDAVFRAPGHPYTAALLQATPRNTSRSERLTTIPGMVPPPWAWPKGCRFAPRCEFAQAQCSEQPPELVDGVRCVRKTELTLVGARHDS